jgi:hypothetical protein
MCTRLCYMWTAAQAQEAQAQEGDKALESHHVLHYCLIRCCILCIQTTGSYLLPTDQLRDHTGKKGLVLKDARRNAQMRAAPSAPFFMVCVGIALVNNISARKKSRRGVVVGGPWTCSAPASAIQGAKVGER